MTIVKAITFIVMIMLILGCSTVKKDSSLEGINMSKLAPNLKLRVKELKSQNDFEEKLRILGKYETISSEELRTKVKECGGEVETVTATIFTARCSVSTISLLSNKDFIKYLELSKKKNLKKLMEEKWKKDFYYY